MIVGHAPELGFSITSPFKAVAKGVKAAGRGVATGAKATGRGIKKGTKFVAHHAIQAGELAIMPAVVLNKLVVGPVLKVALKPVKNKVNTLKDRRARKLAMDRRKSTTPNAQEKSEARAWTRSKVKTQIPFGPLLYALAGPPIPEGVLNGFGEMDTELGEVTTATILSSIPLLIAIMNHFLSSASASGEAPATPGEAAADAQAAAEADQVVAQAQQQAADAMDAVQDAGADGDGGGGGVALPGGRRLPFQKGNLMTIGIIAGVGILAYMFLGRSSDKK